MPDHGRRRKLQSEKRLGRRGRPEIRMGVVGVGVGLAERDPAIGRMVLGSNMVVLLSLQGVVVRQAVAHLREEEGQAQDQDDQRAGGPRLEKPTHE